LSGSKYRSLYTFSFSQSCDWTNKDC